MDNTKKVFSFKFICLYLYYFIKNNFFKLLFLIASLILYRYAGTFEDDVHTYYILDSTKIQGHYQYIYYNKGDNGAYQILNFDVPQKLDKNGNISTKSYADANIFSWIGFVLCIVFFIVGWAIDDDGLSTKESFNSSISWFIRCDLIQGKYYYHVFGKLIQDSNYSDNYPLVYSLKKLLTYPNYENKEQIRNIKLKKLGV